VTQATSVPLEWYQNQQTLDYWVGRGIQTLKALDIPVVHAMCRHLTGDDDSVSSDSASSRADGQRPAKRLREGGD
jgi:hypothetical protein